MRPFMRRAFLAMGGATWNPSKLSTIRLWLDAESGSTLFQDAAATTAAAAQADPVGNWKDKTANAYNMRQADSKRPALQVEDRGRDGYKTGVDDGSNGI